jgi:YVTN family beta-propeller protein
VVVNIYFLPIVHTPPPPPPPCPPPDGCPLAGLDHPKGMAVHEGRNLLYITSRDNDRLLVVDPQTNNVISQTVTGDEPWGVVVNENSNRIYVSNFAGGDLWIYDATTLSLLHKIAVGGNPTLLEILPGLDTVFVVVRANSRVAIIQGATLVQDVTSGGSGPFGIAADPINNRIFVSHRESGHLAEIRQINGSWQTKSAAIMPPPETVYMLSMRIALPSGLWIVGNRNRMRYGVANAPWLSATAVTSKRQRWVAPGWWSIRQQGISSMPIQQPVRSPSSAALVKQCWQPSPPARIPSLWPSTHAPMSSLSACAARMPW